MLVLVVDDEISLCDLLADILSDDYQVIKAYNGKEALALARRLLPAVVVSDVMMPEMSGLELLEALRCDPTTQHIPVVLLSAAAPASKAARANAFVSKPFDITAVEEIVGQLVQPYREEVFTSASYNPTRLDNYLSLNPRQTQRRA